MPPLQRWPTRQSILSWWSDSNPTGPTIPLHTLAKPLLKRLYHRQALGILAKSGHSPLSIDTVETLTSYLVFREISPSTRVLVLSYLTIRADKAEEARVLVDGRVPDCALELLKSPDPDILQSACIMLGSIARYPALTTAIITLGLCQEIVPLFNHKSINVQQAAIQAYACILEKSASEDVARTVIDLEALQHLLKALQESPGNIKLEIPVCSILCGIAQFPVFHGTLLKPDLCASLASILHRWRTTGSSSGIPSVQHPHVQFHLILQYYPPPQSTHPPAVKPEYYLENLNHTAEDEQKLLKPVLYALASLCQSEEGAWAVVSAQASGLDFMKLLSYPDPPHYEVVRCTCRILSSISRHDDLNLRTKILDPKVEPCQRLCSLLRHQSAVVRKEVIYTLGYICAGSEAGAQLVAEALQVFLGGLMSSNFGVVRWTCWMLTEIVEHPNLSAVVLKTNPCNQLVRLLRDPHSNVRPDADYALRSMEESSEDGARWVAMARALDFPGTQ